MKGYYSLCYHYVRNKDENLAFKRILGNDINNFEEHVKNIKKVYDTLSLDDVLNYDALSNSVSYRKSYGMLYTFDDGLSDHYLCAQILSENGIKGVFFIPTCILTDNLPANPMIIHYCIAYYGIQRFLKHYTEALEIYRIDIDKYTIRYDKKDSNPWIVIDEIKNTFKYKLSNQVARKILSYIYTNSLLIDFPNAMDLIHLNKQKIIEIINMGHHIGTHTHTHTSIKTTSADSENFIEEFITPKKILESVFDVPILAHSYPFGDILSHLNRLELAHVMKEYKMCFTLENVVNNERTMPHFIGRYAPSSKENLIDIDKVLEKMNLLL